MGIQSANTIREKQFSGFSLVIENFFHEKRILNGLVKLIKGFTQQYCKRSYFRNKIVHEKYFSRNVFLNSTLISGSTEDRPLKRKILLWGKHVFHWTSFSSKKFWFVCNHSSIAVHNNDDIKTKKFPKKNFH